MMMTKLVRMTSEEYNNISRAVETLYSMSNQLEEMPECETDKEIEYLFECVSDAHRAVQDFISVYRDQFKA